MNKPPPARTRVCFALLILAAMIGTIIKPAWAAGNRKAAIKPALAANSPHELIAAVNSLRAAYGLPAYNTDDALMAAAQGHSDWQATNKTTSHTGDGGSTPKSRAIAAGYGGGKAVFVIENIATGTDMGADIALEMWQDDRLHLSMLLNAKTTDAGAGMATNGDTVYYTLDVGYIPGEENSGSSQPTGTAVPVTRPGTGFVVETVAVVTPMADGSIVHTVQAGEVLGNIAVAYKIKLSDLLAQNNLTDKSVIYPGQKLKIKAPDPTATPTLTETPTKIPTATRRPTRTPTPTNAPSAVPAEESPTPTDTAALMTDATSDPFLIAIGILFLLGAGMMVTGMVMKRRRKGPPT